ISATGIDENNDSGKEFDETNNTEKIQTPDEQAGGEIKGEEDPNVIDKDELQHLLEEAENYDENDYTADSFRAFVDAITAGQNIFEDNAATQADVNEAVDAIQE